MNRPRVLALVLAGGEGSRLGPLTDERAKPALPFAGVYRLIDFPLSNCLHSAIGSRSVIQRTTYATLAQQLGNGRPWDLDRSTAGSGSCVPTSLTRRAAGTRGMRTRSTATAR